MYRSLSSSQNDSQSLSSYNSSSARNGKAKRDGFSTAAMTLGIVGGLGLGVLGGVLIANAITKEERQGPYYLIMNADANVLLPASACSKDSVCGVNSLAKFAGNSRVVALPISAIVNDTDAGDLTAALWEWKGGQLYNYLTESYLGISTATVEDGMYALTLTKSPSPNPFRYEFSSESGQTAFFITSHNGSNSLVLTAPASIFPVAVAQPGSAVGDSTTDAKWSFYPWDALP